MPRILREKTVSGSVVNMASGNWLNTPAVTGLSVGDWVVVKVVNNLAGRTWTNTSGTFAKGLEDNVYSTVAFFILRANGPTVAAQEFSLSGSEGVAEGAFTVFVVRGAVDVGGLPWDQTPVVYAANSSYLHSSVPTTPPTTAYAKTLVVQSVVGHYFASYPTVECAEMFAQFNDNLSIGYSLAAYNKMNAGLCSQFDVYSCSSAMKLTAITLTFRDDGAGEIDALVDPSSPSQTMVLPNTGAPQAVLAYQDGDSSPIAADGGAIGGLVDGYTPLSAAWNTTSSTFILPERAERPTWLRAWPQSGYREAPYLRQIALDGYSAVGMDLTDAVLSFRAIMAKPQSPLYDDAAGLYLGFSSGSDAGARLFKCDALDAKVSLALGPWPYTVQASRAQGRIPEGDKGSFDLTDVRKIIFGTFITTSSWTIFSSLRILNRILITGGSPTNPGSFSSAARFTRANGSLTYQNQGGQADSQVYGSQSLDIGDGVSETHFALAGGSFSFPPAYDEVGRNVHCNVDEGVFEIRLKQSGDCTFSAAGAWDFGNNFRFIVREGTNPAAVDNWNGGVMAHCAFEGRDTGTTVAGFKLTRSPPPDLNDMNWSGGVVISETTGATAVYRASQAELDLISNARLEDNTTIGLTITGEHASLSLPPLTFSNNAIDLHYAGATPLTLAVPASVIGLVTVTGNVSLIAAATITLRGGIAGVTHYRLTVGGALVAEGTSTSADQEISTTAVSNGQTLDAVFSRGDGQYGRGFGTAVVADSAAALTVVTTTDPARNVDDATALAYTGISYNGLSVYVSGAGDLDIGEGYDWIAAFCNLPANLALDVPWSSQDGGASFVQAAGKSVTVAGRLDSLTRSLAGSILVTDGGFFEHANGALWGRPDGLWELRHVWRQIIASADSLPIEFAVYATLGAGGVVVTFDAALAAGGLVSDAGGLVEGYVAHTVAGVPFVLAEQIGAYGFDVLSFPTTADGAPIGSPASPSIARLATNPETTITRAAALALAAPVVTHGSTLIDHNGLTYAELYHALEARQMNLADLEAGVPGFVSYAVHGRIIDRAGTLYTQNPAWISIGMVGPGTLKSGAVRLGAPDVVALDFDSLELRYTAAGTYDHRNRVMSGAFDVANESAGAVVVVTDLATTINTPLPANTTHDASTAITVSKPNALDDSQIRLRNLTQGTPSLDNDMVSGGAGWTYNATIGPGQEIEIGDSIELVTTYSMGVVHKIPLVEVVTAGGGNIEFPAPQVDYAELNELNLDGSLYDKDLYPVTGVLRADYANVQLDHDGVSGATFDARYGLVWFSWKCTTSLGIEVYNPLALELKPDVYNVLVHGPITLEAQEYLKVTNGVWVREDGGDIIAATSATIHWVPDNRVYQGPLVNTGTSLATDERAHLMSLRQTTLEADERAKLLAITDGLTGADMAAIVALFDALPDTTLEADERIKLMAVTDGLTAADMAALVAMFDALPTAAELVAAIDAGEVEPGVTLNEYRRYAAGALFGVMDGPAPGVAGDVNVYSPFNTLVRRFTAACDAAGYRLSITNTNPGDV